MRAPGAVEVGNDVEPTGVALAGRGHVLDVVGVVLDRGADHEGLLDAVGVHLVEELLDRSPRRPRREQAVDRASGARRGNGCRRPSPREPGPRSTSSVAALGQAPRGLYRFNFERAVVDWRSTSSGSKRMSPWRWSGRRSPRSAARRPPGRARTSAGGSR